ncbi:MAG: hypothetical protein IT337_02195, partial [Thermomicrobiales bacterium]|nr:hypothetical protein [Thermomicrobiales bacterium]
MNGQSLAGQIMTVLGPIDPADLGVCMMHEHLVVDSSHLWQVPNYSLIVDDVDLLIDEV